MPITKSQNKNISCSSTPTIRPDNNNKDSNARKDSLKFRKQFTTVEKITFEKLDLKKEKSVSFISAGVDKNLEIGGSIGGSSR